MDGLEFGFDLLGSSESTHFKVATFGHRVSMGFRYQII
jgi:hypothetical protein